MISCEYEGIVLNAELIRMGNDCMITVTGGDRPHLGAVALAEPHPGITEPEKVSATVSVLNRIGHRDGEIAALLAKKLSAEIGIPVCAACGIHFDTFSKETAARVHSCAELLADQLIKQLQ